MDSYFHLTGKVAVITGGNGVLTSVFAEALAEHGAKVALVSRRLEAVQEAAEKKVETSRLSFVTSPLFFS